MNNNASSQAAPSSHLAGLDLLLDCPQQDRILAALAPPNAPAYPGTNGLKAQWIRLLRESIDLRLRIKADVPDPLDPHEATLASLKVLAGPEALTPNLTTFFKDLLAQYLDQFLPSPPWSFTTKGYRTGEIATTWPFQTGDGSTIVDLLLFDTAVDFAEEELLQAVLLESFDVWRDSFLGVRINVMDHPSASVFIDATGSRASFPAGTDPR